MSSSIATGLAVTVLLGCGATVPPPASSGAIGPPTPTSGESAPPPRPPKPAVATAPIAEPTEPAPPATRPPRRGGGLLVEDPPRAPSRQVPTRMRTHVEGPLSSGDERVWVGPAVPDYVELVSGSRELLLLDPLAGGEHLAVYRDPYGAGSCGLRSAVNCSVMARLYGADGVVRWEIELARVYSRPTHLEVQDVRLVDGVLYLNEACQSYSRNAGRRCSSLVAVTPETGAVRWRTRPLISNGTFLVLPDFVVAGYGFTAEPDYVSLVRRRDGRVLHRERLGSAPEEIRQVDGGQIEVRDYDGATYRFELTGVGANRPRLRLVAGGPMPRGRLHDLAPP